MRPAYETHSPSVPIMLRLERPTLGDAEVGGLLWSQLGEFDADLVEMERSHLLVEMLGKGVDFFLVLARLGPEFDLGEGLVRERSRHHERGMPGGVAEIDEPPLGQQQDAL